MNEDLIPLIDAFCQRCDEVLAEEHRQRGYTLQPEVHEARIISESWCRVIRLGPGSTSGSAFAFIALSDFENKTLGKVKRGDIHMPASYVKPARHARGSLFKSEFGACIGPYGIRRLR